VNVHQVHPAPTIGQLADEPIDGLREAVTEGGKDFRQAADRRRNQNDDAFARAVA